MNIIHVIGNLGKDPEVRYTQSGQKITSFSIASNRKRGGKEETTWFRITVWGDQFDNMISHLKKGSMVLVVGELRLDSYVSKEGETRYSLEVNASSLHFVPGKASERSGSQDSAHASTDNPFADMGFNEPAVGTNVAQDFGGENDVPF